MPQKARDALELYYEQFRGIALASRPDDAVPISPSPSPPPQSARPVTDLGNSSHAHATYTVRHGKDKQKWRCQAYEKSAIEWLEVTGFL